MVALQIREVSEDERDRLAHLAAERGQSLQAYLLGMVKAELARQRNRELIQSLRGRRDGSRSTVEDVVRLKNELRAERDRQLLGDDYVDET